VDGIGKTSLALAAGARLADNYPDARIYVDLKGTSSSPLPAHTAMTRILCALEAESRDHGPLDHKQPQATSQVEETYRSRLRDRRVLLVLDDAADEAQVAPLLPPLNNGALITASRPLDLLNAQNIELTPLQHEDARAFLDRRVPRLGPDVKPLARACGYLPLGLRLASGAFAQHADLSLDRYLELLQDAQTRLPLVDAMLSISEALQRPKQRTAWAMLSPLRGPFDAAAAAAVWQTTPGSAQNELAALAICGLIERVPDRPSLDWATSYSLHESVRAYASSRLKESDLSRAKLRLAAHYAKQLHSIAALCGKGEATSRGQALLEIEWNHIQAGQAWAAQYLSDSKEAGQLCSTYADAANRCLCRRPIEDVVLPWLEDAIRAAREWVKPRAEIRHLGRLAAAYQCRGDDERASALYREAVSVAIRVQNRRLEGENLGNLGLVYSGRGDNERAFTYFQQALSAAQDCGDRLGESSWLGNLGSAYSALGEVEQAVRCHRRALTISRELGNRRGEAIWLGNLGNSHATMGEHKRAIQAYRRALVIAQEVGDQREQSNLWGNLGNACCAQGQVAEALAAYEKALCIARELDDQESAGIWLLNMSLALDRQNRRDSAIECAEAALEALSQAGSPDAERVQTLLKRWKS
jgi:tetratricopeptide (TPR) repeat protein